MRWTHVNSMPEGWSWMSKAWAENISDESIVDRYLTYCFDLTCVGVIIVALLAVKLFVL